MQYQPPISVYKPHLLRSQPQPLSLDSFTPIDIHIQPLRSLRWRIRHQNLMHQHEALPEVGASATCAIHRTILTCEETSKNQPTVTPHTVRAAVQTRNYISWPAFSYDVLSTKRSFIMRLEVMPANRLPNIGTHSQGATRLPGVSSQP